MTYQKSIADTENSEIIKKEAYTSKDLTATQLDTMKTTKESIDTIKSKVKEIESSTVELVTKVSHI